MHLPLFLHCRAWDVTCHAAGLLQPSPRNQISYKPPNISPQELPSKSMSDLWWFHLSLNCTPKGSEGPMSQRSTMAPKKSKAPKYAKQVSDILGAMNLSASFYCSLNDSQLSQAFTKGLREKLRNLPASTLTLLRDLQKHIEVLPLPQSAFLTFDQEYLREEGTHLWNECTKQRWRDPSEEEKKVLCHGRTWFVASDF